MLDQPRAFPREVPIGPGRQPVEATPEDVHMLEQLHTHVHEHTDAKSSENELQEVWGVLASALERAMCLRFDCVDEAAEPDAKHCGRAKGFVTTKRAPLPPTLKEFGALGAVDRGRIVLAKTLQSWAALL